MLAPLFIIFERNKEEITAAIALPSDPPKHDREELIIVIEGTVEHFIDFKNEILNKIFLRVRIPFILGGKYLC